MHSPLELQMLSRTLALRAAHLTARQARRNATAKGGEFWQEIGDSIQVHEEHGAVAVGATHVAAAMKHFGGRVSAPGKGAGSLHRKALTIPIGIARANRWDTDKAEDAGYDLYKPKGKSVIFGKPKKPKKGKKAQQDELLFVLRKAATIPADPWWPDDSDIHANIARAISDEFPSS